jgi:uncharacterized protein YjbI with pentapeptide repeats
METRTIRGRTFLQPDPDTEGLDVRDTPPARGETLTGVVITRADWSRAQLDDSTITHSALTGVGLVEARIASGRLTATTFRTVDFSTSRWEDTKVERCTFVRCTFMGANLADVAAENVIFEDCRLDYAYLTALRAVGSVAFVRCSMREATFQGCRLPDVVFADCTLADTEFSGCDLRGADFRGSNIELIQGVESFRGTTLEAGQLHQLTTALAKDFGIAIADSTDVTL